MKTTKGKILFISIILIFLLGCTHQNNENENNDNNEINQSNNNNDNITNNNDNNNNLNTSEYETIIVAYGDSLTHGLGVQRNETYPAQLEKALQEQNYNVKVYNSGLSGETSSGALARVDWVLRLKPDIVLLGIGANDAIRGIDLNITEKNIREIVKKLKNNDVEVILLGQIIYENLGTEYVTQFEQIYPKIAEQENVTLIPVFLEGVAGNSSLNNPDEIHPNEKGYEIIVKKNIMPEVSKILNQT